ncbi:hypothetical protein BH23ACT9_BH23ACT9_23420 [soil metagenome]
MDATLLLPLLTDVLAGGSTVVAHDPRVAAALRETDPAMVLRHPDDEPAGSADAVLLLAGELALAGERAPAVLDAAVRSCRPGGLIAAAVPSAVWGVLAGDGQDTTPGMTAAQLSHAMAERGLDVRLLAAPGAAARLAGRRWAGAADLSLDATPGLLDSGPVILAAGRTPKTRADRSVVFFSSITRKIVAASVLCLDGSSRLLLVFDTFRNAWTLPGGLVDAAESPVEGAVREAREEGGVDVEAGDLLGVFAHDHPERVHLVYAATPREVIQHPVPLHTHEIREVRWVPLDQAARMLDGHMRRKLADCLDRPGRTWRW